MPQVGPPLLGTCGTARGAGGQRLRSHTHTSPRPAIPRSASTRETGKRAMKHRREDALSGPWQRPRPGRHPRVHRGGSGDDRGDSDALLRETGVPATRRATWVPRRQPERQTQSAAPVRFHLHRGQAQTERASCRWGPAVWPGALWAAHVGAWPASPHGPGTWAAHATPGLCHATRQQEEGSSGPGGRAGWWHELNMDSLRLLCGQRSTEAGGLGTGGGEGLWTPREPPCRGRSG